MPIKNWTPERIDRKRRNHRKWISKNKESFYAYNRNYHRTKSFEKSGAPCPPDPCHCGNAGRFKWDKESMRWICKPCLSTEAKASKRQKNIDAVIGIIRKFHGPELVESYLEYLKTPGANINTSLLHLKTSFLPPAYHNIKRSQQIKIHALNRMAGKPLGNVGWSCFLCGVFSMEHMFFDKDHILPKSKKGTGRKDNLQVICPNCHRLKTIKEFHRNGHPAPHEQIPAT